MDKTSMTLGWLVCRQIAGQRKAQEKQPIAYLYNGVELPDINTVLPDEIKAEYPYHYIYEFNGGEEYIAYFLPVEPEFIAESERLSTLGFSFYVSTITNNPPSLTQNTGLYLLDATKIIWSNHDIINAVDGSVYLSASDPIPVYE